MLLAIDANDTDAELAAFDGERTCCSSTCRANPA